MQKTDVNFDEEDRDERTATIFWRVVAVVGAVLVLILALLMFLLTNSTTAQAETVTERLAKLKITDPEVSTLGTYYDRCFVTDTEGNVVDKIEPNGQYKANFLVFLYGSNNKTCKNTVIGFRFLHKMSTETVYAFPESTQDDYCPALYLDMGYDWGIGASYPIDLVTNGDYALKIQLDAGDVTVKRIYDDVDLAPTDKWKQKLVTGGKYVKLGTKKLNGNFTVGKENALLITVGFTTGEKLTEPVYVETKFEPMDDNRYFYDFLEPNSGWRWLTAMKQADGTYRPGGLARYNDGVNQEEKVKLLLSGKTKGSRYYTATDFTCDNLPTTPQVNVMSDNPVVGKEYEFPYWVTDKHDAEVTYLTFDGDYTAHVYFHASGGDAENLQVWSKGFSEPLVILPEGEDPSWTIKYRTGAEVSSIDFACHMYFPNTKGIVEYVPGSLEIHRIDGAASYAIADKSFFEDKAKIGDIGPDGILHEGYENAVELTFKMKVRMESCKDDGETLTSASTSDDDGYPYWDSEAYSKLMNDIDEEIKGYELARYDKNNAELKDMNTKLSEVSEKLERIQTFQFIIVFCSVACLLLMLLVVLGISKASGSTLEEIKEYLEEYLTDDEEEDSDDEDSEDEDSDDDSEDDDSDNNTEDET